jgi:DNA-binding NarL/FixJ family response regulator
MDGQQTGQTSVRVLVLSDESLFSLGVQNLLRRYPTLRTQSCESDLETVLGCLETFQPHVVVLDSDAQRSTPASEWMDMLRSQPHVTFLGLSLQDNTICIYRGETRQVTEVGDLLRVIEHHMA